MTTMKVTAITTIAYTLGQKAKAENRKGWQTVKALTCSQSVSHTVIKWLERWLVAIPYCQNPFG